MISANVVFRETQYQFRNAMNYGKAIRITRALADISQRELATRLGTDPSYVSLLEANKREPSRDVLEKLAAVFRVPLHLLVLLAAEGGDIRGPERRRISDLAEALAKLLFAGDDDGERREDDRGIEARQPCAVGSTTRNKPRTASRPGERRAVLL